MKQQLELPMLATVSRDIVTIWNSSIPRVSGSVSYDLASPRGSVSVAELRGNHGSSFVRIYDKRGGGASFPVQMCLDLFTPET